MKAYNAEQVSYEVVNVDTFERVKSATILTDYEIVVGDIIIFHGKMNKSDLFNYVVRYNVSLAIVKRALRSLVDYGLVTEYTQQALILQSIKGTIRINSDTDSVDFVPTNDYWLTSTNKPLVSIKHINFDNFDFADTNNINTDVITQQAQVVTKQVIEKALPPTVTMQSSAVTAEEIKLSKRVIALKETIASQQDAIDSYKAITQELFDLVQTLLK